MSDDKLTTDHCRECGDEIPEGKEDNGICSDCAKDDEWVECEGCSESGWAGCDNMFTFHCKECEGEICESCSSNNLCSGCEMATTGVSTFTFR